MRRLGAGFAIAFAGAVIAALVAVPAAVQAGPGAAAVFVAIALALGGVVGVLAAAGVWLAAELVLRLRSDRAAPTASQIHGAMAYGVVFVGPVVLVAMRLMAAFRAPALIGLVIALFAAVWAVVAAAVARRVARVALPARLRGWRSAVGIWLALGWLGVLGALVADSAILRVFPFVIDGAFTPQLVAVLTVAGVAVMLGFARLEDSVRRYRRGYAVAGGALAVLTVATLGWLDDSAARRVVLSSPTLSTYARVAMVITDVDRDGFSHVLGGGDCAPLDGAIHPNARDAPADGIDQNCNGADYAPGPRPSPLPDAPVPAALQRDDLNVLFITIDTLRYDHLGFAGHERDTSPTLDALARRGAWFEHAYSTSYRTWFAMPAMVASQVPDELGIPHEVAGAGRPHPLPDAAVTLAETLRERGYATGMFTSFFYFDRWRLDQGMDAFTNVPRDGKDGRTGAQTIADGAIAFIGAHPTDRWFAWLHFFEPHHPYDAREVRFGDSDDARYDSEIRHVDDQIGRVLAGVDLERTIVVVTSDHGEGLGERGVHGHTAGLHDFLLHVPLIVAVPGAPPRRVRTVASTLDVAPTIAAFAGVAPAPAWTGRAHVAAVALGRDDTERIVFAADPVRARYVAITQDARLIHDQYNDLYTFSGDDQRRERLRLALMAWRDRVTGP